MNDVLVSSKVLFALAERKLVQAGLDKEQSARVADVLVHADSRGVHSHGVMRVEHYCKRIKAGGINIKPNPQLQTISASAAIYDADDGMGHVGLYNAMQIAIDIAKQNVISFVGIKNTSHCGALSYFVQQATDQNMIGIAMTQTDKCVAPPGGAVQFFGTNPIAFGFPVKNNNPVICDMATSAGAFGKMLFAKETGEALPEGWIIDENGDPTTDANKYAAFLHFAGHKGYCLALAIDVLTGVLLGGQFGPHITAMYNEYEKMRKLASLVLVIDPKAFGNENFLTHMATMVNELHNLPVAKGSEGVMVPGDPQFNYQQQCEKEGIPIPEAIYDYLKG